MKSEFENFNKNNPFFFDGAFGTYYFSKMERNAENANSKFSVDSEKSCENVNIDNPELVKKIHLEYITAGVNGIKSNTFGANSFNFPEKEKRNYIIRRGYEIAKEAAQIGKVSLFADIGYIFSDGSRDASDIENEYVEIAQEFLNAGATNFIFETMAEFENIKKAICYIRFKIPNSFIVVSFAVSQDGYSLKGHFYKNLISKAFEKNLVDVAGLNCVCGPNHMLNLIEGIDTSADTICAMPNSGYPETVNGRTIFRDNKEYFSEKELRLFMSGVYFLGGCCGTTPGHLEYSINQVKRTLLSEETRAETDTGSATGTGTGTGSATGTGTGIDLRTKILSLKHEEHILPGACGKNFLAKLNSGEKVIAIEIDPPGNADVSFIINASMRVKELGADLVTVADSPLARARADSIILSAKIKRETGIDVLPHLSCRDKNVIGIKGALLGAVIENIENVLVITGDPMSGGDSIESKGVFSFNSTALASYINELNKQIFSDNPITICGALNINAINFKAELERALRKEQAGVKVFFTQPVFSQEAVENIEQANKTLNGKLMTGILPVAGYKNAVFLNNEVPGIHIPEEFISSIRDKNQEEAFVLSVNFSNDIINKTYQHSDGYYIMTPMKRIDLVCEILKARKNRPCGLNNFNFITTCVKTK